VDDNYQAQYCGGSLVNRRFVLTAAHCVDDDVLSGPDELEILTGTNRLNSSGTRRAVDRIFIHPRWNKNTFDYDIAVIKLTAPVGGITPVKIITSAQALTRADAGTPALVAGWGDTTGNEMYTRVLREVQVPIVTHSDCNDANSYDGDITSRMICAGLAAGGKDSCQGDSGGPLVVRDSQNLWKLQAGIVSWGFGCAEPDLYGVYSRLAVLGTWARRIIATR
jgi:secreted trypsin-like serine protease